MFLNRALANAKSRRNFPMTEAIEFVQSEHLLGAGWQLRYCTGKPNNLFPVDKRLLGIWSRVLDFTRIGVVLHSRPLAFPAFTPSELAQPIEHQIVRHSKNVALGIGDWPRPICADLYPKLT
jgi:hypothetical protein